ncbi:general substrate transporter [Melanomma pulvis-pyrius CBS 109.77]|uniref:General substrate transporter n=1 Tax=Melanomma pulvis-pyrius CBS 109.77 TaxID=1314802 RepID=A0A6A6XPY2_9PLEO|nr:general substrate transporter [Melanomma pulvis-pyrius CBS 109.77]
MSPQKNRSVNAYTWGCSLFAAVGSLLYGIDSGIVSTTIAQPAFVHYFAPFTPGLKGALVSTFGAGAVFGVWFAGWSADYIGRKKTIMIAAVIALIAGIIQASSVHIGMLIAGRIVGGFAVGIMNMTIPIYNSEIAPPHKRGMIAGLHAQFVGIGFACANWVGFGCSYASGQFQWRFPLAFQCLPAIIVLLGIFWLPYSPRWLLEQERDDEAYTVIKRLHGNVGDDSFFRAEFTQMRDQLRFEKSQQNAKWSDLLATKSNRKRILLAVLVQAFTQLSGINVINYFQTDLYKSLGQTGHMVTLLAGVYGLVGPLANVICLYYVDTWGRKKTLWITGLAMALDMSLVMALSGAYGKSDNTIAKGFSIAFIFCFSIIYSLGYNSIHYIYVPEIMTMAIRAKGSSISVICNVLINIIFNQVSPIAFTDVGYKYYSLFICTNLLGAVVVFLIFPETKGKTLEEIALIFGEEVIVADLETIREKVGNNAEQDEVVDAAVVEDKKGA